MSKRPALDSVRKPRSCSPNEKPIYEQVTKSSHLFSLSKSCDKFLRFLRNDLNVTVLAYFVAVVLISLISDYAYKFPPTYFSNRRNILNLYFVKIGWGWTLSLVGLMLFLTSSILCGGDIKCIGSNLSRLIFSTFWWYFGTTLIEHVAVKIGFCSGSLSLSSHLCKDSWIGLDISGHAFLLTFCSLVILEESKTFADWDLVSNKLLASKRKADCNGESEMKIKESLRLFAGWSKLVYCSVILVTALFVLWNLMFLMTLIYFHDALQKILGFLLAVVGWFISYRFLYKLNLKFVPQVPEKCCIHS